MPGVSFFKPQTRRLKAREEDKKYSKAQTAARRRAAVELEKQAAGPWWSKVGAAFGLNNLTAMANRCQAAIQCILTSMLGLPVQDADCPVVCCGQLYCGFAT